MKRMKHLIAASVLALGCAAASGQNRCILVTYPCDPLPTHVVFTILDCQGKVLDFTTYRLSNPCNGQAQFCVPLAMGNVRVEATVVANLTPVKFQTFNVGCP